MKSPAALQNFNLGFVGQQGRYGIGFIGKGSEDMQGNISTHNGAFVEQQREELFMRRALLNAIKDRINIAGVPIKLDVGGFNHGFCGERCDQAMQFVVALNFSR